MAEGNSCSRDNGKRLSKTYTHTDRCLDFHSHHDKNHKISTAATLIHRATKLPNTDTGKNKELKRVYTAVESNGYPVNLIADSERKKRVPPPVPAPEELVGMFIKWVDPPHTRGFATLPYIKGLTETLTRLLRRHDVLVTNKPVKTLQQEFPATKFRPEKEDQYNVVYKFPAAHVRGAILAKPEGLLTPERKSTLET